MTATTKTLPKKFEICTKYNRTDKFVLENYEHGMYRIAGPGYRPAHTAGFVQACLTEGSWIMTKNLDEPEIVSEGRDLVFPLFCTHSDPNYQAEYKPESFFKLEKGNMKDSVVITWRDGRTQDDFWTVEDCKRLIKNGTWLVKHVGEKVGEFLHPQGYITEGAILAESMSWDDFKPQAPQSAPTSVSTLTLNVDTKAATEAVARLTEALEALAISYESVIALQRAFKESV